MEENKSSITIKKIVEKLTAGGRGNLPPADCVEYGLRQGWLEPQDAANQNQPLLRKQAARIIHNYLRMEVKESDEIDGSPAYVMQDLFDCRICAGHIIQVYVKGIMDGVILPDGRKIFDAEKEVSLSEAEEIVIGLFQKEARRVKKETGPNNCVVNEPEKLTLSQAMQWLQENETILLVDVRTEREYEQEHLENAINIPLISIIKNPFVFNEKHDKIILLYCNEGYQSKAAAQCMLEAGYQKVAFFAKKEGM